MAPNKYLEAFDRESARHHTKKLWGVVLHHTDIRSDHDLNGLLILHQNRGFAGIGYHFVITSGGEVISTRPIEYMGAHARGANNGTLGIAFNGKYGPGQELSTKAIVAATKLVPPELEVYTHNNVPGGITPTDCGGPGTPIRLLADALNGKR